MKRFVLCLAVLVSFSLLAGCAGAAGSTVASDKLSVVTSFYPMYDFACKVGGDKVSVTNLTPSGVEPHDWEPASSDMIMLEKADVFIYNGAGFEHWVDSVLSSLENKELIVVEASAEAPFLDVSAAAGEESASVDPHVWLDPEIAKT